MQDRPTFVSNPVPVCLSQTETSLAQIAGNYRGVRKLTTQAFAPRGKEFAYTFAPAVLAGIANEYRDGATAGNKVAQQILTEEARRPGQENGLPSWHISAHTRMNKWPNLPLKFMILPCMIA
jgi:hypothetical protein